jgi:hypothetical protein
MPAPLCGACRTSHAVEQQAMFASHFFVMTGENVRIKGNISHKNLTLSDRKTDQQTKTLVEIRDCTL